MAILQSALVEPLLSRQQAAVLRDIARASQLMEALKQIQTIKEGSRFQPNSLSPIEGYLQSEISRVLMQIKIPAESSGSSKSPTTTPGKTQ